MNRVLINVHHCIRVIVHFGSDDNSGSSIIPGHQSFRVINHSGSDDNSGQVNNFLLQNYPSILVAPIYQNTKMDEEGNDTVHSDEISGYGRSRMGKTQ